MTGGGRRRVGWTQVWCVLLGALAMAVAVAAVTDGGNTAALVAVKAALSDPQGKLSNWNGDDPCGLPWTGVFCAEDSGSVYHVTELRLMQFGLGGTLAGELGSLKQLQTLNVMWNQITGPLPPSLGNLGILRLLLVSGNQLDGPLPAALGGLSTMIRFQIDSNNFSGPIPDSFSNLTAMMHLHMNNNSLSGTIPSGLGTLPAIVHIILDNNLLTGRLPSDFFNNSTPTLQIVQADNNPLDPQSIPAPLATHLIKLSLRNCNLRGSVPGLVGAVAPSSLEAVDLRDNLLSGLLPDLSSAPNLTTVALSGNNLAQNASNLPSLASFTRLQAILLAHNGLNGTLDVTELIGTSPIAGPFLLDLQNNSLARLAGNVPSNLTLFLSGNLELCTPTGLVASLPECQPQNTDAYLLGTTHPDSGSDCQKDCPGKASPKSITDQCLCLFPVTAGLRLKSPSFSFFEFYRTQFQTMVAAQLTALSAGEGRTDWTLSAEQVYVQNYSWSPGPRLEMKVQIFPGAGAPAGLFEQAEADQLFFYFSNWKIVDDPVFGPYELRSWDAGVYAPTVVQLSGGSSKSGMGTGAVVGIVVAGIIICALALALAILYYQRRRYLERSAATATGRAAWRGSKVGKGSTASLLNVTGVQAFSFEELCIATEGFVISRKIGQGGYGKVYRGVLEDGQEVAIKRAQEDSLQGSKEFYTEIELLSRVHHRNLVRLVGYCDDAGEQMLVYEFVSGGTLREFLSASSEMRPLTFQSRVRVALGSARGIAYLHNEASPPIFHRDIKASNILLDDKGNAKVSDFGLSKLAPVTDLDGSNPAHVSTVVKGTPGYLDPEYFLTHKLTDKSDVYSFGVVLLELITGMQPISHGKNIVREVNTSYQAGKVLTLADSRMGIYPLEALEPFVKLALACCHDNPDKRPSILEVVRDLDNMCRSLPEDNSPSTSSRHRPSLVPRLSGAGAGDESYLDASDILTSQTVIDVAPR